LLFPGISMEDDKNKGSCSEPELAISPEKNKSRPVR